MGNAAPRAPDRSSNNGARRAVRVLAVGTLYPPRALGGYARIWKDAVGFLRQGGHEVRVLCSDWAKSDTGEGEDPDVHRALRLYVDDVHDVRREDRAAVVERELHNRELIDTVLAEFRPQVCLLGPTFGVPLSVVTRIRESGVPQAALVADEWPKHAPRADPGQQRLGWRWTARLFGRTAGEGAGVRRFRYGDVDRWLCASERAANVVRRAGADPSTLTTLEPGPDARRFAPRDPKPWRGELLYAGALFAHEGVEHAIEALAAAPQCKLTVAGTGDARSLEKLQGVARDAGVEDRVRTLGEQYARMPELYADADALVYPSVGSEVWALAPLEAMLVGRPVIGTNVGGAGAYLRDGENSLVVRPSDPAAIAAAADRLAGDEELRARLVQGGFATADEYRYDRFLERLAGAVVTLGESPREMDEKESVSEPPQRQPAGRPQTEEPKEREAPGAPAVTPAESAGPSASPAPFARMQGQQVTARPGPVAAPGPTGEKARMADPGPAAKPGTAPKADAAPKAPTAPDADAATKAPTEPGTEPETPAEDDVNTSLRPAIDDVGVPDIKEWLPEGEGAARREPPLPKLPETTEWAAITPEPKPETPAEKRSPATGPRATVTPTAGPGATGEKALDLISRLAAMEARVDELSSSAISGLERSASGLATLEGRVAELATSAIGRVERNVSEPAGIEKHVTEIANSAVAGVERNASQLAAVDRRLAELAAAVTTAREHQGSELGTLQTRVGELATFVELRSEALGQRIDELERRLETAEGGRGKSLDQVAERLEAIDRRLGALEEDLQGVQAAVEPLAALPGRLERVEALASEAWQREQAVVEQHRAAIQDVEQLEGLAKLNESSFEQLRAIGLSGTQAARLLAAREARSRFDSVEELESIPGFPRAVIAELQQLVER